MEKIFDNSVCDYLMEAGVSIEEINRLKFSSLKTQAIKRLNEVIDLIKDDKFSNVEALTMYSPAGDFMGSDNNFIDFGFICGYEPIDILELCEMLKQLKN